MNRTIAVDQVNRLGPWLTPSSDRRWLRRHVEQLVAMVPDPLAPPVRALLEEVALSYSLVLEWGSEPTPESCRRVHAAGEACAGAGMSLDWMVTEFGELTVPLADLLIGQRGATAAQVRDVMNAGNKLMREFIAGANRWRARARDERKVCRLAGDLVGHLIAGREPPREAESQLGKAYLIAVVNRREGVPARFAAIVRDCGGPGTLIGGAAEFVALIPEPDPDHTERVVDELGRRLDGQAWVGVASRERSAVADGYREAADILALVVAGGREPGVYRLEDCLVEYAVSRSDTVAESLVSIVTPLMANSALWETLEALIRADFNRNRAAKQMFVHRSTLDYRLHRIEEVTGHDPMSNRGAQLLRAAMTAHAMAGSPAAS